MSDAPEAPAIEEDKPINASEEAPEAVEPDKPEESEESFTDFNPDDIPENVTPEWLREQHAEMRKGFTQKTMEFGETRREAEQNQAIIDGLLDPQTRLQYAELLGLSKNDLLETFGYEVVPEEEEEGLGFEDEDVVRDPRVDVLLQERQAEEAQRAEQAQLQGEADYIEGELQDIEDKGKVEFSDEEAEFLTNYSRSHPDRLGRPDVRAAHKVLQGIFDQRQRKWIESRRGAAPAGATGGVPGSQTVDPSTREGRIQMAREAAEGASSQ